MNKKRIYSIVKKEEDKNSYRYSVKIDFSHPVFNGHFPGNPILPGVMMCDIIKELSANILELEIKLILAKNIKFLRMIIPSKENIYNINISIVKNEEDNEKYNIKAVISQNENNYFKLNGDYKKR